MVLVSVPDLRLLCIYLSHHKPMLSCVYMCSQHFEGNFGSPRGSLVTNQAVQIYGSCVCASGQCRSLSWGLKGVKVSCSCFYLRFDSFESVGDLCPCLRFIRISHT